MASHGTRASSESVRLPGAVPFTLPAVTRLDWELGTRVTTDADATLVEEWVHLPTGRTLAVYDATSHTVVLGVRTPVGRERFYAATKGDLDSRRSRLEAADDWRRA